MHNYQLTWIETRKILTPKQNSGWPQPAPASTAFGGFPEPIADEPRLLMPLQDGTSAAGANGGGGDGDDEGEAEDVRVCV